MFVGAVQTLRTAAVNLACLGHLARQLGVFSGSIQQVSCHPHSIPKANIGTWHSSAASTHSFSSLPLTSPLAPASPCSLVLSAPSNSRSGVWHSSAANSNSSSLPLVKRLLSASLGSFAFSAHVASSSGVWLSSTASTYSLHSLPLIAQANHGSLAFSTRVDPSRTPKSRFEDCCAELEKHAAKGTSWPQHSRTVLQAVNDRVGGRWLVVECGQWVKPGDPKDGQPARALLHMATGHMPGQEADAQPVDDFDSRLRKHKGKPTKVSGDYVLLKAPTKKADLPPGRAPFLYLAAYELDDNQWPTGRMYNSVRYFEEQTSKAQCKKAESSCRVIWGGEDLMTLHTYLKQTAQKPEYGMTKASKDHTYHIANRYRELVESAGVEVMRVLDAASKSSLQKAKREANTQKDL